MTITTTINITPGPKIPSMSPRGIKAASKEVYFQYRQVFRDN
jgi:hypothetical protein